MEPHNQQDQPQFDPAEFEAYQQWRQQQAADYPTPTLDKLDRGMNAVGRWAWRLWFAFGACILFLMIFVGDGHWWVGALVWLVIFGSFTLFFWVMNKAFNFGERALTEGAVSLIKGIKAQ